MDRPRATLIVIAVGAFVFSASLGGAERPGGLEADGDLAGRARPASGYSIT